MIIIEPYNPSWPMLFENEAIKIRDALGNNCLDIHHIGSTSVPDLSAKPIIDILPVVESLKAVDLSNSKMQKLGYVVKGEWGFMLRRFFVKENSFHVHVFEQNDPNIDRHVKFRNWMRNNAKDRIAYAALKEKLALKYPADRTSYTIGKDEFVASIDEKAGWSGIRIVKALTNSEWDKLKEYRKNYFDVKLQQCDPYLNSLDNDENVHLIVLKKTDIIGYAHIEICKNSQAIIRFFIINEDKRKQQFGTELLKFIEKWLINRDFKSISVKSNPAVTQFFKMNGFINVESKNYLDREDIRWIVKTLV